MTFPYYLSVLVFSPLAGLLVLLAVPKDRERAIKWIGLAAALPAAILSLAAYLTYHSGAGLEELDERADWFQFGHPDLVGDYFKIGYELGADGFAMIMILLTSLLALLAAAASFRITKEWKGYFMLFLLLETGMLGVFAAENLFLFFLFFEISLIPMFFLIGKWGLFEKEKAAFSFLIYNGLGSAILLIVFIVLFARTGTANIQELQIVMKGGAQAISPFSEELKLGLFIALLIAFGVKLPIFPLHSWMVRVHAEAPASVVMLHAGILLKIGAFGLIRFGLGFFPEQFQQLGLLISILGAVNLLYGAFLAFIQDDFRKVLAYSSISHMGIVLIGLGALNEAGVQGAIFQVVSHGLISALLFYLVGALYERVGTSSIKKLGGLSRQMPLAAGFLLAGAMASLGMPGMSGFISEFMAFLGLFENRPAVAAVVALGIILTAVYLLRAVLGMTFGEARSDYGNVTDLKALELMPAVILVGAIVLIGVYPLAISGPLQPVLETILPGMGG